MTEQLILNLPIGNALVNGAGTMLPERVIQEVLKLGFAAVDEDQEIIDDLFHKLDDASRRDMKQYYDSHKVTVRMGFPRDDITWPMVCVVAASDEENAGGDFLGDFMGEEMDASGTQVSYQLGHAVATTLNIYCLAGKDSNAVMWLYYLAKAILVMYHLTLESHGLRNVTIGGKDVTLREDLMPEFTFARVVSLRCDNFFSVRVTERVARVLASVVTYTDGFTAPGEAGRLSLETAEEP